MSHPMPEQTLPSTQDVVICGGGFAGLLLARHLRQEMPELSVEIVGPGRFVAEDLTETAMLLAIIELPDGKADLRAVLSDLGMSVGHREKLLLALLGGGA